VAVLQHSVHKSALAFAMIAVFIANAGAGARAAEAAAPPPYDLNVVLPLTGQGAFLGSDYAKTLEALTLQVNRTGGIGGHPIRFVVSDSASNPAVSLQVMNGLIAKGAPVVIDGGPSYVCNPTIGIVHKTGPVDVCLSSAVHPEAGSYAFSSGVSTPIMAEVLVRYLRLRGWTRLALITGTDATGLDFDVQMNRALALRENASMTLVAHEHFNVTDLSVAAQMARIKAAAPQVLMTWSTGTPFGLVLHGIQDSGLNVPVTSVPANENYAQMEQYASFLPSELYFPSFRGVSTGGTNAGPVRDAQIVYRKAFNEIGARPDFVTDMGWDSIMIVIGALRALGPKATPLQIRDYVLQLHSWAGINGIYDFRDGSQSGVGANAANIQRWDNRVHDFVAVSRPGGYI
jgi:branched-chain amino acid transport system substrate-binding protein